MGVNARAKCTAQGIKTTAMSIFFPSSLFCPTMQLIFIHQIDQKMENIGEHHKLSDAIH